MLRHNVNTPFPHFGKFQIKKKTILYVFVSN
jgi:hypothetical protein